MNKRLFTVYIAFLFFLFSVIVCQSAEAETPINLDEPGELEKLAHNNPEHYVKIKNIINQIHNKEPSEIEKWLKVDYGVSVATLFDNTWLTTSPPKKRLDFVLGKVSYRFTITVYSH